MTTVTLSRWGNSNGIRIPNQFLKQLNLVEGMQIEVTLTSDNQLLLRPLNSVDSNEELRSHLDRLLSKIKVDSPRHEEIDFGIEGDELI
ncbi:AbrB/MazE/SpoVT family DNA-binding domain-containing protein [Saccharibacillus sp. CPCC 101409]|uniref:AbrB/MazE/SpoVT family DNA-binding domain-containing protein n=1 Tax=Saccharibacillus sp. CPCC 101409 TaxID=3058041 RepID=UPI002671686E|nr:AbrB/MazE/SpoVT family DNA-binding domain-containing protein [Saccharibacillus sp. CPCC 101409]MDO3409900.1 AbrB/MazE/SpoVT family DNA-binding domain-containing protein [Saccharibacillus sp. CPCC 101409]